MIESFNDRGTNDVFDRRSTKAARRTCPEALWERARDRLDQLHNARELKDLRLPPSNMLERLHREREGQWSIRINDQYRVCFTWTEGGAHDVEIEDYHKT